jgi:hypothetical protein
VAGPVRANLGWRASAPAVEAARSGLTAIVPAAKTFSYIPDFNVEFVQELTATCREHSARCGQSQHNDLYCSMAVPSSMTYMSVIPISR